MNGKRSLCIAIGLVTAPAALPALAQQQEGPGAVSPSASGLTELSDEEMGDMRGRYTVSSTTVAWFGVTMVSTWQNQAGQQLTSSMKVSMDVSKPDKPQVTFQPHVSITAVDAPPPVPGGQREIDNAGLANVTGVAQSVQVAGDANVAHNVAKITVRDQPAESPAPASSTEGVAAVAAIAPPMAVDPAASASTIATASVAGMSAVAQLEDNAARVLLQIDGQGAVEQWISRSGMGQTIQLAADGQQASNWMELDIVRNTSQGRTVLGQNVAQAISLSRGIAVGY
ncbi:hypothetical protein MNQ95_06535 [Pseudoxanthomonas daejeonensis]|uniref:hypothetical protein n=1 Tax=Pseudoxanthomonas daejeonensis TaxID=266062 RepID=UPI001F547FC2|nr:hypothetical protein [Pseudoxanthomonas daejeonensis]UNK58738.1 hypothetical protein MNQ95_06535 [Pseudoxanthomonas daejeonensis]